MLFNSYSFIFIFLPVVYSFYALLRRQPDLRMALILVIFASLVFYGWGGWFFLTVFMTMMAANTVVGQALLHARTARKPLLVFGVGVNLAVLGAFKYAGFLAINVNAAAGTNFPILNLVLPIGISFYTFMNIALLVDIYRGHVKKLSVLEYFFFMSFFPHLVAGPILHHSELVPQIRSAVRRPYYDDLCVGLSLFSIGLFKKTVVADGCAIYADAGYAMLQTGQVLDPASAWVTALSYSFQIYYDFSGYSDMAIGLARMFGFVFPVNFFSPYRAVNIIDFWRRWHITLSRFLRDYLYIPLGGGRAGPMRRSFNLVVVMLLGGLWHGANWTFIVWGGVHGLMLSATHLAGKLSFFRTPSFSRPAARRIGIGFTFLLVTLAWVPFRSPSLTEAGQMIGYLFAADLSLVSALKSFGASLFQQFKNPLVIFDPTTWAPARELWPQPLPADFLAKARPAGYWLMIVAVGTFLLPNTLQIFERFSPALHLQGFPKASRLVLHCLDSKTALAIALLFVVAVLHLSRVSPFLYFQF